MRTILIVDDENDVRKRYKKYLVSEGFTILEAASALEAAESIMRSRIDLILLDFNLPEVDGRGISDIIEEYPCQAPVIVTSVLPVQEQKIRIPRAVDYYDKSHKQEVLRDKIKKVLGV